MPASLTRRMKTLGHRRILDAALLVALLGLAGLLLLMLKDTR